MRDIPFFTTQLGVASLTLSQIPYTQKAFIRIQDSSNAKEFLEECISFCRAAGANQIYATGHHICALYPEYTSIIQMRAELSSLADTDVQLFPVTEQTIENWRSIYNKKIIHIPGGAWMTIQQGNDLLKDGYFVHRDGQLLGIGKAFGDQIHWIASVFHGAGADVVKALCRALTGDSVSLEVASANEKAIALYEKLGFIRTKIISTWYCVK